MRKFFFGFPVNDVWLWILRTMAIATIAVFTYIHTPLRLIATSLFFVMLGYQLTNALHLVFSRKYWMSQILEYQLGNGIPFIFLYIWYTTCYAVELHMVLLHPYDWFEITTSILWLFSFSVHTVLYLKSKQFYEAYHGKDDNMQILQEEGFNMERG